MQILQFISPQIWQPEPFSERVEINPSTSMDHCFTVMEDQSGSFTIKASRMLYIFVVRCLKNPIYQSFSTKLRIYTKWNGPIEMCRIICSSCCLYILYSLCTNLMSTAALCSSLNQSPEKIPCSSRTKVVELPGNKSDSAYLIKPKKKWFFIL